MSGKVAPLVPSQETPPSCWLGGRVWRRPEDWAPVDRCAGQCDDEALHDELCKPLALVEPTPTDAMSSPTEMAEPTTYTLSHLGRLQHPNMTEVWGRVSELATLSPAKPCRPQGPQIRRAGHPRERRGYLVLPESAEFPPERGRATEPPPFEGKGVYRRAPLLPTRRRVWRGGGAGEATGRLFVRPR